MPFTQVELLLRSFPGSAVCVTPSRMSYDKAVEFLKEYSPWTRLGKRGQKIKDAHFPARERILESMLHGTNTTVALVRVRCGCKTPMLVSEEQIQKKCGFCRSYRKRL